MMIDDGEECKQNVLIDCEPAVLLFVLLLLWWWCMYMSWVSLLPRRTSCVIGAVVDGGSRLQNENTHGLLGVSKLVWVL